MKIHVLPGDSLVETFEKSEIEGEVVVCRECLIEGDLLSVDLNDLWRVRENFLSETYPNQKEFYRENVKSEFEKLLKASDGDEVNLWFEYELFCQANMWFCLWLLRDKTAEIFRVEPIVRAENDLWKGFGNLSESDLQKCFERRIKFANEDVQLGANLWNAFANQDFENLRDLGRTKSVCFPHLEKVCEAAIEMRIRPENTLRKIIARGESNFNEIFKKFQEAEGVYGFGDSQVKRIYDRIAA